MRVNIRNQGVGRNSLYIIFIIKDKVKDFDKSERFRLKNRTKLESGIIQFEEI